MANEISMDDLSVSFAKRGPGLRQANFKTSSAPRTRIVYSVPMQIQNQSVFGKVKVAQRISRNTVVLISTLYRCKHPDAKILFDQYCEHLIQTQKIELEKQQSALVKAVKQAESQGYKFGTQGAPATVDVTISNEHTEQLVALLMLIDESVDLLNKLSAIHAITDAVFTEHHGFAIGSIDYIDKHISHLLSRLDKECAFKPGKKLNAANTKSVDFEKVKQVFQALLTPPEQPAVTEPSGEEA